jgi:hypothetical protein
MDSDEMAKTWEQVWPRIVAKAWMEPGYQKRLEDPKQVRAVLQADGLPLIPGVDIRVITSNMKFEPITSATMCLPLPDKPAEVKKEDLKALVESSVVASDCSGTSCCC